MDVGQFDLSRKDQRCAIKPLWSADNWKSEKGFIAWFYEQLPIFEAVHEKRIANCINNVLWFTGEYDGNTEYRMINPDRGVSTAVPKYMVPVVISHLYDLTEQRVASLAVNKPNFEVRAHNSDEAGDRTSASHMKTMISAVRRTQRVDSKYSETDRYNAIFGEAWLGIEWDETIGPKGKNGKPIGDVRVSLKEPFWIMYEPKRDFERVNCLIEIYDVMHIEEVNKKYKTNLKADELNAIWSFEQSGLYQKDADEIVIYRYLEKPNEYNPDGCEVLVAGNKVLKRSDKWRYNHGDFPYERITDIDVPGRLFPISFYNYLIPIQHQYNKMTSMINRSITMFCHPKWFMTKGSCKVESLGNSSTIVQVTPGAQNPKLEIFPSIGQEQFKYRDSLRTEMSMIGATQGVSRGEPPPGARAASMLRFYEEQEQQRRGTTIDKRQEFIRRSYSKIGSVIQQFYPENKERIIRHIGRQNRYDLLRMDETDINTPYDIDINNASSFSESKSARMEEVAFALEKLPGTVTPEQAADVLGYASPEKFYDVVTAALKEAENENSDFMDGKPVPAPEACEDVLMHRKTHLIMMQTAGWKRLPQKLKDATVQHVKYTEMIMYERARKSLMFAQILSQLPDFPIYAPPQLLPVAAPQGEQQAPQGKPQQGKPEGQKKPQGDKPKGKKKKHSINHPKLGKFDIESESIEDQEPTA